MAPGDHPDVTIRRFAPTGSTNPSVEPIASESAKPVALMTDRPVIRLAGGEIERIVDEAEAALIESDRNLYQSAGRIVSVGDIKVTVSDETECIARRIVERGDYALVEDLTAVARFERFDVRKKGWTATDAPMNVAKTLRQRRSRLQLPVLTGYINSPTMRRDGSIVHSPGYDSATGLLYDPRGVRFLKVAPQPTRLNGLAALATLEDLFSTMPFKSEVDKAVAISMVLTACSRNAYTTAPMHAITAPTAGSGKSMIVDTATMIATGRRAAVLAQGKKEEETEKRLVGALLSGDLVLALDNCDYPVGSAFLCQILTQPVVRARVLGGSPLSDLSTNVLVTATGNNLIVVGDMTRRALICTIDPMTERPEGRKFDMPDPVARAQQHRSLYVHAALTALRSYFAAGRPAQTTPLGSFEGWSRTVRDAMIWLGSADPTISIEEGRRNDPKLTLLGSVLAQWKLVLGPEKVTVADVIEMAEQRQPVGETNRLRHPEFNGALAEAAGGTGGSIDARRLGQWLAANKDRITDGLFIKKGSMRQGLNTWRLCDKRPSECASPR